MAKIGGGRRVQVQICRKKAEAKGKE